ncbi:SH3 domain-containing protein C23A1.17-like, partial [Anneissia japonica]|uniref:SH3 domain-containing protein C23A1.17-like n=1 Tax=Anneissia japonica TaxID=1529436 RepID=UPI001425A3F5
MVSVGTVTSPVRGIQPAANSATNRVGVTPSRSKSDVAAAPGSNKEIFRIAGAVGNGNLNVPNGSIVDIDKGVFVTPKASFAPSVLKSQAQEKLFMQQLRFIHRQSINQRKGRKSRPPIVVQRHLLPRIQSSGPIRNMMSLSTSTGKFTPVDASSLNSVDPSCPKIKLKPVSRSPVPIAPNIPILSPAPPVVISPILNSPISSPVSFVTNSPSPVTVPQTMQISAPVAMVPISAAASVMPIVAAPSTPCPIVAIPVTTNQVYAQQAPPVTSVAATPPQNKTCDSSVLSTPSPPSNDVSSTDSHAKDGQSSFRLSPPPNLSSILDISLPSADAPEDTSIGGESLIAMAMDTAGLT